MHFADAIRNMLKISNLTITSPGTPPNAVPHTLYLLTKNRRINKSAVKREVLEGYTTGTVAACHSECASNASANGKKSKISKLIAKMTYNTTNTGVHTHKPRLLFDRVTE